MSELVELSASQLKAAKLCLARWGARYLHGLPDEAGPAAEAGKVVHAQLEAWALHGTMPTDPRALKGLPHATAPGTASIERAISFTTPQSRYKGFVDVEYVYNKASGQRRPVIACGLTHDHVIVQDWKTTSNMSYALTVDTLPDDIQFNIYLYEAFKVLRAKTAAGKWVYLPPSGPAQPVIVPADRNRVLDFVLGPVDTAAKELQQLYQIRPKWQELPKDTKGCFAFGKQCPRYDECKPTQQSFSMAEAGDIPTMTDFRNSIANDFPGAAGAPALPPSLPPAVPATPPAAPGAADLPPEVIAELVANELRKRRAEGGQTPGPVPGKVDQSFVNPPEADPTPAANPAQASAQQNVKAPEPPKPVEDVLTGWNRDQLKAYGAALGIEDMAKSRAREPSLRDTLRAKCIQLGIEPGAVPGTPVAAPAAPAVPPEVELPAPPAAVPPPAPAVIPVPEPLPTGVKSTFNGFTLIDGRIVHNGGDSPARGFHLCQILEAAHQKLGVRDYGLIQYEGAARLCGAVEDLFHLGEIEADVVVFDSTTREGSVLANTLTALAAHRA